jgi:SAM-dependent methyltransferase
MLGEFFLIKRNINCKIESALNYKRDKILDLGCGENPYYHDFVKGDIVCLDIRKTKPSHVVSDANNPPFRNKSFDKIISVNLVYYLKDPFDVIKQLHKMLKDGGKLVLVMPFFYPIHDVPIDKYRFTEYGIRALLESKFKIERLETVGGLFNLPAVIIHSLIKGIPLLFPKRLKGFIQVLMYILWPVYILAQLIGIFDFLDQTKRYPTYYFVVAKKI